MAETTYNPYVIPMLFLNELIDQAPNKGFYCNRISELVEIAKEEGLRYNETSESYFWNFIRRVYPANRAGLILTDDGNLIAAWDDNNENCFDIEFMEDKTLEYVAFNASNEYEEGSGTIDDILRCINKFNFEGLLGVNVKQKAIERNHNVVRYVGHSKIHPITNNILRLGFKLRESECGLSVNWLEYYADKSKHEQLKKIQCDMKSTGWSIGIKGVFAELNIGDAIDKVFDACKITINFSHVPRHKNPSHALVSGLKSSSKTSKKAPAVLAKLANQTKHHKVSDLLA